MGESMTQPGANESGPRSRASKRRRAFLALAFGFASALLAAELAVRVFPEWMPEQAQLRMHWRELEAAGSHSIAHPVLGFTYRPNFTGELARRDFHFSYRTDRNGFRNPEPLPETAQLVVVGDSLAFGYGVDDAHAWTQLVSDALPDRTLVNLALPGFGPEQYARAFETLGAGLRPERVIVGVFPMNDLRDGDLFERWLKAGGPGNYDHWRMSGGSSGVRAWLQRSYLYTWIEEALKAARSAGWYRDQTLELPGGGRLNLVPSMVASASKAAVPGNPSFERALDSLARLVTRCREGGARELMVLFPSKEEVYLPTMGEETPQPVRAFAAAFEERGWETLDLTATFRASAARGEQLFFEVDGHPNGAGYALVADAVLNRVR